MIAGIGVCMEGERDGESNQASISCNGVIPLAALLSNAWATHPTISTSASLSSKRKGCRKSSA